MLYSESNFSISRVLMKDCVCVYDVIVTQTGGKGMKHHLFAATPSFSIQLDLKNCSEK